MANANKTFRITALLACALALVVVVLGAYTRLSNAGLGCPDWPGCYGHLLGVPETTQEIEQANSNYPQRAFEADKAWKEVIHRYFASVLGVLILFLAILAVINRHTPKQLIGLPILLVGLVIFQALLGMWTVTLLLKPVIVMLHLLGGLTILSLLWWLYLKSKPIVANAEQSTITAMRPIMGCRLVAVAWADHFRRLDQCQLCCLSVPGFSYLPGPMVARDRF